MCIRHFILNLFCHLNKNIRCFLWTHSSNHTDDECFFWYIQISSLNYTVFPIFIAFNIDTVKDNLQFILFTNFLIES